MKYFQKDWKKYWNKKGKDEHTARTGGRKDNNLTRKINDQVIHVMNFSQDDIVLDIGCGGGLLVNKIASHVSKSVGIDLSQNMLSFITMGPNAFYIQADMQYLPFKKSVFSKIICISALMYIPKIKLEIFFHEINNITVNGGKIFLGQLINHNALNDIFNLKGFKKPKRFINLIEIVRKKIAVVTNMLAVHNEKDIIYLAHKFGFKIEILPGIAPQSIYMDNYFHYSAILTKL